MGGKIKRTRKNCPPPGNKHCVCPTCRVVLRGRKTRCLGKGREATLMTHDLTGRVTRTEGKYLHHHLARPARFGKRLASGPITSKSTFHSGVTLESTAHQLHARYARLSSCVASISGGRDRETVGMTIISAHFVRACLLIASRD